MAERSTTFLETGYSVIPSFLHADDIRLFAQEIDHVVSSPRHTGMSRPGNNLYPLRWNDPIVARILQSKPHLSRLRSVVAARDLKWLSGYVSIKEPHSPALWWHQDWWCWDHPISFRKAATQIAVLCYLSGTRAHNGALRILPGSHHASTALHEQLPEPHGELANALPVDHPALADLPEQVTLELHAGDAVVIDYRLLHGTHANETADRRDCILLSFIPAWREMPADVKAHLIAHPALPGAEESKRRLSNGYDELLPRFDGVPANLPVNRVPPARFTVCD